MLVGFSAIFQVACDSSRTFEDESQFASKAEAPYCAQSQAILGPSRNVEGTAHYEFRSDGNGLPTDAAFRWSTPTPWDAQIGVDIEVRSSSGQVLQFRAAPPVSGWSKSQDVLAALASQFPNDWDVYRAGAHLFTAPPIGQEWEVTRHQGLPMPTRNPHPHPIRLAEVAVLDPNGQTLQCGTTDDLGHFSVSIPASAQSWRLEVRARAHHHRNSTSILDSPDSNRTYALIADASDHETPLRLRAKVRGDLLGGAFHMLELTLRAQDYLRSQTQGCDPNWPACKPFERAPRAQIYWRPGRSPNESPQSTSSASYYIRGSASIYISGGLRGNTVSSDMDHFDDAVVLHEYAHFLEDFFGHTASPGGAHDGDSLIDPRLAWSEGFANFLQAAITGRDYYRDSYGTPECPSLCAGALIHESFEHPERDLPDPDARGEGIFREFAVSRLLHSALKQSGFVEIWLAFQSRHLSHQEREGFPTFASFHKRHSLRPNASDWTSHLQREVMLHGEGEYATPLLADTTCSPTKMFARRMPWDWGDWSSLDWNMNNDFLEVHHPGGTLNAELHFAQESLVDTQLYLWAPGHRIGIDRFLLAKSTVNSQDCQEPNCLISSTDAPGFERRIRGLSVALPAGVYLLQLRIDARRLPVRTKADPQASVLYQLKLNGEQRCPRK